MDADILGLPKGADILLRDLIHERIGLFYDNGRGGLLMDKLSPLVVERGFASFLDYYYLLKYDKDADDEWLRVRDALSVPETYFWREVDQIKALVEVLIPRWTGTGPIQIWSAACASGEEPLSIAMALNEGGWFQRAPIEMVASDASQSAIRKARSGLYRERAFRNLPALLREKYFTKEEAGWRVDPQLHSRIHWKTANLLEQGEIAPMASAAFIFCRNVFIYFSEESIRRTLQTFSRFIQPEGCLFVSASESLIKLTRDFELREIGGAFVYVRRPADQEELT